MTHHGWILRGDSAPCTANSEVKVHSDRDHVPVVVKLLADDVLVLGFDLFEPDIAIGAVDGTMSIEEELQPAARMKPEAFTVSCEGMAGSPFR